MAPESTGVSLSTYISAESIYDKAGNLKGFISHVRQCQKTQAYRTCDLISTHTHQEAAEMLVLSVPT